MLGAIVGDIVGSPYEFTPNNIKTGKFSSVQSGIARDRRYGNDAGRCGSSDAILGWNG